MKEDMRGLTDSYTIKAREIEARLQEFRKERNIEDWFYELCFCIMAVQTSGLRAAEVEKQLREKKFFEKDFDPMPVLRKTYIRFHNRKSEHLIALKKQFPEIAEKIKSEKNNFELRAWLVKNIKGIGLKEGSHFLRNIGRTQELAILDRHILRNMEKFGIITGLPKTLTEKVYFDLEKKFQNFSKEINLTPAALDLYFWSEAVGVVGK